MKRFSRLLLIAGLAIACLPLERVAAAPLFAQPVLAGASKQTMQLADLSGRELCQYQNMADGSRRYGNANWCLEQKHRDERQQAIKRQEIQAQERREEDRKTWEKDRQNKEYWDKKAQERAYLNKQYWDKKYFKKKQQDREYWEKRDRARGR